MATLATFSVSTEGTVTLMHAESGEWYELGSDMSRTIRFLIVRPLTTKLPGFQYKRYEIRCVEQPQIRQLAVPNTFIIRQITDPEEQAILALQLGG